MVIAEELLFEEFDIQNKVKVQNRRKMRIRRKKLSKRKQNRRNPIKGMLRNLC